MEFWRRLRDNEDNDTSPPVVGNPVPGTSADADERRAHNIEQRTRKLRATNVLQTLKTYPTAVELCHAFMYKRFGCPITSDTPAQLGSMARDYFEQHMDPGLIEKTNIMQDAVDLYYRKLQANPINIREFDHVIVGQYNNNVTHSNPFLIRIWRKMYEIPFLSDFLPSGYRGRADTPLQLRFKTIAWWALIIASLVTISGSIVLLSIGQVSLLRIPFTYIRNAVSPPPPPSSIDIGRKRLLSIIQSSSTLQDIYSGSKDILDAGLEKSTRTLLETLENAASITGLPPILTQEESECLQASSLLQRWRKCRPVSTKPQDLFKRVIQRLTSNMADTSNLLSEHVKTMYTLAKETSTKSAQRWINSPEDISITPSVTTPPSTRMSPWQCLFSLIGFTRHVIQTTGSWCVWPPALFITTVIHGTAKAITYMVPECPETWIHHSVIALLITIFLRMLLNAPKSTAMSLYKVTIASYSLTYRLALSLLRCFVNIIWNPNSHQAPPTSTTSSTVLPSLSTPPVEDPQWPPTLSDSEIALASAFAPTTIRRTRSISGLSPTATGALRRTLLRIRRGHGSTGSLSDNSVY